jgi:hypothetical protein
MGGGLACLLRHALGVLDHERAKSELKALMPEDAQEATGHGVRGRRSKSGAVSFGARQGDSHAPVRRDHQGDAALAKALLEQLTIRRRR